MKKEIVSFQLELKEKKKLKRAAKKARMTLSAYIRSILLKGEK